MPIRPAMQPRLPGPSTRTLALVAAILPAACVGSAPLVHRAAPAPTTIAASPRSAQDAARLALERSPRVAAARHAFDAACARRRAVEVPPDLRIELMTGIPLMEMGATPLRISLGASLAWLLNRDNLASAADRAVDASAATLATAACEVASEAREAYRTVLARMLVAEAARARRAAFADMREAERAAARAGERSQAGVDAIESRFAGAERGVRAADGQLELAKAALASLVGGADAPMETDTAIDAILAGDAPVATRIATRAEAVAAAMVAERRRAIAALEPAFGSTLDGAAGFERDMEGDEMVFVALATTIPSSRLPHEIEVARASLAEAEAVHAEAVRLAELEARTARIAFETASLALDAARDASDASARAFAATEAALAIGERSRLELARGAITRADAAEALGLALLAWSGARGRLERIHPLLDRAAESAEGDR